MAIRRVRRSKRPARKQRAPRRNRARKGLAKQYATIEETVEYDDFTNGINYPLTFSLNQFDRASKLATNFRWYKAVKVVWSLEPLFNTFSDSSTSGDTIPYLYKIMDRTQDNLSMNLLDFQASGCKPIKLTSKKVMSYTPNWCSAGLTTFTNAPAGGITNMTSQGLRAQYTWLASPHSNIGMADTLPDFISPLDPRPTIPSTSGMNSVATNCVAYNGMDILLDQAQNVGTLKVCRCVATVTWQFKDPKHNGYVREFVTPIVPKYTIELPPFGPTGSA